MTDEILTRRMHETRAQGKNRRGKPRKMWIEGVREAAEERNIQWEDIVKGIAENRRLLQKITQEKKTGD
ncbi:hypothetical protein ILUMI_14298 [Ignelater luminosus]|uniref:Uncharacterized protein n=1 Tax=Ignelater luminosus TaxID=2038154 RepID=A0A8K0CWU0_IGNLU|nr:hypothetical protein ILUMI_14298 [Ignelater luminosus]